MSYLEQDDKDLIEDIMTRKEFYWNKRWCNNSSKTSNNEIIPYFLLEDAIQSSGNLRLSSYQQFVSNYMNPNTPYKRLLMKWQTGAGKSVGALSIAMNFINNYKLEADAGSLQIGSVFIIGFSKRIFMNELLRFPEFGFLTKSERLTLDKLRRIATRGSKQDVDRYKDLVIKIKKKFGNRKGNGYFKFDGYKSFVNNIFISSVDINSLSEREIVEHINDGRIKYNAELLAQFKNSLMICDEIHNVYNSSEKNNWGIAIQAVLDKEPTCRAVFASATPINNSPTEIVDLLNLLLPAEQRLRKSDFFTADKKLKPGAIERIAELSKGRVSYVRDVNPKYYPRISMIGETIPTIDYLQFIRCPMSDFHYNTYKNIYHGTLSQDSQYLVDFVIENPEGGDGIYQTNIIRTKLLNASNKWKLQYGLDFHNGKIVGDALTLGKLEKYSTKYATMMKDLINILQNKGGKTFIYHNIVHMSGVLFIEQVLLKNGFIDENGGSSDTTLCAFCGQIKSKHSAKEISGGYDNTPTKRDILLVQKKRKYIWRADDKDLMTFRVKNGKYVVAHDSIHSDLLKGRSRYLRELSRLLNSQFTDKPVLIRVPHSAPRLGEWLLHMGFKEHALHMKYVGLILGDPFPTGGSSKKVLIVKEKKSNDFRHRYIPARYILIHSDIDKGNIDQSIERFNNPENARGYQYMVLIGSKIMKESHDIKAIQNVFIMSKPDNIPTLLQIRGRSTRKNSHKDLPYENRQVNVRIYTSCLPIKKNINGKHIYGLSYEEEKYREKIESYKIIQKIEKVIHENAIDSVINSELINRVPDGDPDPLDALKFTPNINKKNLQDMKISDLNTDTFDIYHQKTEIETIRFMIKRFFMEVSPVWTHGNLLKIIRDDPLRYENDINTSLFTEELFMAALDRLLWKPSDEYVEPFINKTELSFIDNLFDNTDRTIFIGTPCMIVPIMDDDQYYIACPLINNEPVIDIEVIYRTKHRRYANSININHFMNTKRIDFDYDDKRRIFYRKYLDTSLENMENVVCEYGTTFHIKFLEECIDYVFRAWTDPNLEISEYHEFYFKMLYYYDLLSLVMWAYTSKQKIFREYKNYAIPVKAKDIKLKTLSIYEKRADNIDDISPDDTSDLATSGVINLLKTSINRTSNAWIPAEFRSEYDKILNDSFEQFRGRKKKAKYIQKVSAKLLPIGHYISKFPKIFHPERGWTEDPTYIQHDQEYIENDTIIGYDERSKTGVHIRFKLRNPIHNIKKHKDSRLIEKGTVCKSKSKPYLRNLAKKLDITIPDKLNVDVLCTLIRSKLIRLELKERIRKSKIKYFYFHYEQQLPS